MHSSLLTADKRPQRSFKSLFSLESVPLNLISFFHLHLSGCAYLVMAPSASSSSQAYVHILHPVSHRGVWGRIFFFSSLLAFIFNNVIFFPSQNLL